MIIPLTITIPSPGLDLGYTVLDLDRAVYAPFTAAGMVEVGNGVYAVSGGVEVPAAGGYVQVWTDDGGEPAEFVGEAAVEGAVGDPWATALPGAYGAGTAGKLLSDIEAGSAPTPAAIRAEIDANSTRLAAIQLVTDLIDVSDVTLAPVNMLGHLTITTALTFETSITGLVVPSDWTSAMWTLKRNRRDLDTASIIKLVESNPGVGTDGVTVLNGAAPGAPLTAADGALTIDAGVGTAGIRLTDDLTALLAVRPGLIWGLKFLRSNGDSKEYSGTADIDLSVVHGV